MLIVTKKQKLVLNVMRVSIVLNLLAQLNAGKRMIVKRMSIL